MIRICFLLGGFQRNGGIGRATSILVNQLCQDVDFEIHTISYLQEQGPTLYNVLPEVKTHVLNTKSCSMTKSLLHNHAIQKVRTILKKEKIDFLISCGALYYPLGIMACKGLKTKSICWEHTNPSVSSDYRFQSICRSYAARKCSQIVVLTKEAEQYYREHYPKSNKKIMQIYNPISNNASRSKQYDINSKKIISVGRLSYPKNFDRLISIASYILPQYPDWSWDIYGDGELKDSLQTLIGNYNLERQLSLRGQVSDLYDRYCDYAFMVMTSRYEGFPMSLIEGAANRLPLISFDIPTGPKEIIIDEVNGFLVNPESDDEMIKKIKELIENSHLRKTMSDEVFHLSDAFALERILKQWKNLFKRLY